MPGMRRQTKRQTINNLRDSNEALGRIVDNMMLVGSIADRPMAHKLLKIAGIVNGFHNGPKPVNPWTAVLALDKIADVLGEPF